MSNFKLEAHDSSTIDLTKYQSNQYGFFIDNSSNTLCTMDYQGNKTYYNGIDTSLFYLKTEVYNTGETYTKIEVNNLLTGISFENYYTKDEVYNTGETYTRTEIENLLTGITVGGLVVENITYSDLLTKINSSELTANFYLLTDYKCISVDGLSGNTEVLILQTTSPNTISNNVNSVSYPDDLIVYDVSTNTITLRIDTVNKIDCDFDFRGYKTNRYKLDLTQYSSDVPNNTSTSYYFNYNIYLNFYPYNVLNTGTTQNVSTWSDYAIMIDKKNTTYKYTLNRPSSILLNATPTAVLNVVNCNNITIRKSKTSMFNNCTYCRFENCDDSSFYDTTKSDFKYNSMVYTYDSSYCDIENCTTSFFLGHSYSNFKNTTNLKSEYIDYSNLTNVSNSNIRFIDNVNINNATTTTMTKTSYSSFNDLSNFVIFSSRLDVAYALYLKWVNVACQAKNVLFINYTNSVNIGFYYITIGSISAASTTYKTAFNKTNIAHI